MPRRKFWTPRLFLYEKQKLKRIECAGELCFHVGIWWHDSQRLVAFLQSIAEIKGVGHFIDSDLSHDWAWETARHELSCHEGTEYFEIPRGRIVWNTYHQAGVLYHGNSTPHQAFHELARIYRLPRWDTRLDEHYLTGEALEDFYRLD